jgi:carbon storage regulator
MLVLSRKRGQSIVIGEGITLSIERLHGNRVQIGIEAPANVSVRRKELERDNYMIEAPRAVYPVHGS